MCITTSRAVSACVACFVAKWASFGFEDGWRVIWCPGARRRPSHPGRAARGPVRGRQGRAGASCRLSRLEDGPDRRAPVGKEEVGRDVVGDLRAQLLAGYLVEAEVLPGVDAAEAGLIGRVREARERALDSRQDL